jgi:uncharacterized membrane protein YbhN (UPF0104 family)
MKKKRAELIKKIISYSVLLIVFTLFIRYIIVHKQDFKNITLVNPVWILTLVLLYLALIFAIGLTYRSLFQAFNVKMSPIQSFNLTASTNFYNLITPLHGGTLARGAYMKKSHNLSYSDYFSVLIAAHIILFFIAAILGLIISIRLYYSEGILSYWLTTIFISIISVILLFVLFSKKIIFNKKKASFLRKSALGWLKIRSKSSILLKASLFTLLQFLIGAFAAHLQFQVFGINLSPLKSILFSVIWNSSMLLSLTPSNIGVNEAITVIFMKNFSLATPQIVAAAFLWRASQIISLVILGPILSIKLFKEFLTKKNKSK